MEFVKRWKAEREDKKYRKELVPASLTAQMLETCGLPWPDRIIGPDDGPHYMTREDLEKRQAYEKANLPTMEELLKDPDVAAVIEAANGMKPVS